MGIHSPPPPVPTSSRFAEVKVMRGGGGGGKEEESTLVAQVLRLSQSGEAKGWRLGDRLPPPGAAASALALALLVG